MNARAQSGDVLILGGGLLGSALAYHLSRSGERPVRQYTADARPSSSDRSAGILTFLGWDLWDLALVRESLEEYRAISERTGLGDLQTNGGIRLARTEEGRRWLDRVQEVLSAAGVPSRTLPASDLSAMLPDGEFDEVVAAVHTPGDSTFSPGAFVRAYQRLARKKGCEVERGDAPATVVEEGSGWRVKAADRSWRTETLVLACGAWTKSILAGLGFRLPLAPFRAQAAELRPRPLSAPFPAIHDLDLGMYLRTAANGRLIVGDGNEPREADPDRARPEADADFLERMERSVRALLPGLRGFALERGWAGVCVASPDRYPIIGPVPGARGLYLASGFNGLGAMRAPAIARRLAEGIASGQWSSLRPADPARFTGEIAPFDPRPEFPLEADPFPAVRVLAPSPDVPLASDGPTSGGVEFRAVRAPHEIDAVRLPPLSEWFDPFLPLFMRDALATGGEAEFALQDGEVCGVYLASPTEGVGSVFTSVRAVAEHYLPGRAPGGVYAERAWTSGGEPIAVLAADLRDWAPERALWNPVHIASPDELPRVAALMREVTGAVDSAWLGLLPRPEEVCVVGEVVGRVAGVSWATVVGRHARGHSFLVHPRFRGLGIGSDLLQARMIWLRGIGVRSVVSEIYEGNEASRTAAERAGMAEVGRMFHFRPPTPRGR